MILLCNTEKYLAQSTQFEDEHTACCVVVHEVGIFDGCRSDLVFSGRVYPSIIIITDRSIDPGIHKSIPYCFVLNTIHSNTHSSTLLSM